MDENEQRDFDSTWAVPADDLDATWPTEKRPVWSAAAEPPLSKPAAQPPTDAVRPRR